MAFSGGLTITDLDDFLTPSQACIIPVRNAKPAIGGADDGPTEIHIDSNNNYYEVATFSTSTAAAGPSSSSAKPQKTALEKAEINLNDCLACSGCITSTESLLITLQSQNEVHHFISSGNASTTPDDPTLSSQPRTPVLSLSPQTLASLSASYSTALGRPAIPLRVLLRRIRSFLSAPRRGGWRVWDTTFARHMSLKETIAEFQERQAFAKGKQPLRGVPLPGPLPVLASACPGWVCYAEKAQADMLPLLSSTRSSQAVIGALVKTWWAGKMGLKPHEIYHVTAMPCYDKKLEASRSDFYSAMYGTRDIDCVLTTGELDMLLSDLGFDPYIPAEAEDFPICFDITDRLSSPWPETLAHRGSSSGSYLAVLLEAYASAHPSPTRLVERAVRDSPDNVEYLLTDALTGEVIFKGAKCYGFRNLQNLVRRVGRETGITKSSRSKLGAAVAARRKRGRAGAAETVTSTPEGSDAESVARNAEAKALDFVEVMACPSGCVNGGGQMKPAVPRRTLDEEGYERPLPEDGMAVDESMRWSTKEWVARVEDLYWTGLPTPPPSPGGMTDSQSVDDSLGQADGLAEEIIREVCGEDQGQRWEFLRTKFRKVEGDVLNGGITHEAVKW